MEGKVVCDTVSGFPVFAAEDSHSRSLHESPEQVHKDTRHVSRDNMLAPGTA